MISHLPILSFITFLPLFGAFIILLTCSDDEQGGKNSKMVALWTSSITFLLSIILLLNFNSNVNGFQFVEKSEWIPISNISYHMGVDGISLPFVVLSTFLIPICIISSLNNIKKLEKFCMTRNLARCGIYFHESVSMNNFCLII